MTTIRHALKLDTKPATLRAALNTEKGLRAWWAKDSDIGTGENAEHELRFKKGDQPIVMRFRVDLDSEKEVRWTCTHNDNPVWVGTTLSWSMTPNGDATDLVFEHAGFAEDQSPPYKMTVGGWDHFIESLRTYIEEQQGQAW